MSSTPWNSRTVVVDLDGTLADYEKGSISPDGDAAKDIVGPPLQDSLWAMNELIRLGFDIVVQSCRPNSVIEKWLKQYGFPIEIRIGHGYVRDGSDKTLAVAYVDDRAFEYTGNWRDTVDKIVQYVPWWKKEQQRKEVAFALLHVSSGKWIVKKGSGRYVLSASTNLFVASLEGGVFGEQEDVRAVMAELARAEFIDISEFKMVEIQVAYSYIST